MDLTRRAFLTRTALIGCSAAASPLLTPISFAAAPFEQRFVVIILRGAMDGVDVVQPYGDRALAGLRPKLGFGEAAGALDLDGMFALHPGLAGLMPLWAAGELGFAHAVSTPYRDKRSHFDGQDLLEAGTAELGAATGRDGWLNRMLQTVPGLSTETAYAIGHDEMAVLSGRAPVANWAPDAALELSPQARRLMEKVMHDDPLFRDALAEALLLARVEGVMDDEAAMGGMAGMSGMAGMGGMEPATQGLGAIADFAAERLRGPARIAAFSIGGWDTHAGQSKAIGRALGELQETILRLKAGLGPIWGQTAVVAMTEFGRTARENGTGGTDHGTGGAALMAGGAIKGGRVYGEWPGLEERALYQGRDLMPTRDVRAYAGWIMRGLFGLETSLLESAVFPGLDMGKNPGLTL